MPTVSVVIPVRDRPQQLDELIASLPTAGGAGESIEVIVVDDGSAAGVDWICSRHGARHIRFDESKGPARARNVGAAAAAGSFLLFLDSDVRYPPGLIERAVAEMRSDPTIAAVSFMNQRHDARDNLIANYSAAIERFWLERWLGGRRLADIEGFTTRCGVVRASAFEAVSGYDERYQLNACEDYDFGRRLASRFRTTLADAPSAYHAFPVDLRTLLRNYVIRCRLFVHYTVAHRSGLDREQTSRTEMFVRGGAAILAVSMLWRLSGVWAPAANAAILIAGSGYLFGVVPFLRHCWRTTGSAGFTLGALLLHFISSSGIALGGLWGLLSLGRRRPLRQLWPA